LTLTFGQQMRLTQLRLKRGEPIPDAWQRALRDAIARVRSGSDPFASGMASSLRRVLEGSDMDDRAAAELGRRGWTVPPWATYHEVRALSKVPAGQPIDRAIMKVYSRRTKLMPDIHRNTLSASLMRKWAPLYRQVAFLASQGQYLVVVPSSLLMFEGLLASLTESSETGKRLHRALKPLATAASGVPRAVWLSIATFTEALYASRDFAAAKPALLNRHWILHGRSAPRWGKADCVRLFQAINTVCLLSPLIPISGQRPN
jgi:hypothetical protein